MGHLELPADRATHNVVIILSPARAACTIAFGLDSYGSLEAREPKIGIVTNIIAEISPMASCPRTRWHSRSKVRVKLGY